jgi:hypothetical protein
MPLLIVLRTDHHDCMVHVVLLRHSIGIAEHSRFSHEGLCLSSAHISWLKRPFCSFSRLLYLRQLIRCYLLYAPMHTYSFSGTKIKQEMVDKFAAFLTVCSSVEDLEYVVVMMYTQRVTIS